MKVTNKTFPLKTKEEFDFIDITDDIEAFVTESSVKNGLCNIQSLHTTAPVFVNENEPLLIEDIKKHFRTLIPKGAAYQHNDFNVRTVNMCDDECKNGHSHCLAIHLPTSVTLNLIDGKLQLGTWQRIFFVELDHSRERKFQVQVIGE